MEHKKVIVLFFYHMMSKKSNFTYFQLLSLLLVSEEGMKCLCNLCNTVWQNASISSPRISRKCSITFFIICGYVTNSQLHTNQTAYPQVVYEILKSGVRFTEFDNILFIGRGGTGREAMTWAVSRKCAAEDKTNRVNLQSHEKLQADIDFYKQMYNISNNLTFSTFSIYKTQAVSHQEGTAMFCKLQTVRNGGEWQKTGEAPL